MKLIWPLKSLEIEMYARNIHAMPMTSGTVAMTFAGKVKMTRNSVPTIRITCRVEEVRLFIHYSTFSSPRGKTTLYFLLLLYRALLRTAGREREGV